MYTALVDQPVNQSNKAKTYACTYCPRLNFFASKNSLQKHISKYHREHHKKLREEEKEDSLTCANCNGKFSTSTYTRKHEQACCKGQIFAISRTPSMHKDDTVKNPSWSYARVGQATTFGSSKNSDQAVEEEKQQLPQTILCDKPVPRFATDNGVIDMLMWELQAKETDLKNRRPVLIEADIRKLDWKTLAAIQFEKYGCLFHVIYMDPPWNIRLKLGYPVLSDADIMAIPFETLQKDGYLFIWIVDMKEELIKKQL